MKSLGAYKDFYGQSNTLLLPDVFENFRNMCLEICELDPARFPIAPGLAWPAILKQAKVKLDPLTDADLLLMVEKISEVEHVMLFINLRKLYINDYGKNKES